MSEFSSHPLENGPTTSYWSSGKKPLLRAPLTESQEVDVCIIGAGIAGVTCAYLLSKEGYRCLVLDSGPVGGGQTLRTTGHLCNALDDRFFDLEFYHGEEGARLAAESHTAAIDRIETIIEQEKIACDFERVYGYLFASPEDSQETLYKELQAVKRAGLQAEMIDRVPWETFDTGPCLRFARQAQFEPYRYLSALAEATERLGGEIYNQTPVIEIEEKEGKCYTFTQNGRKVISRYLIVATNSPINDRLVMHTKQAAYRTYVIGFLIPRGAIPKGLYWDTPDPYHYVRIQEVDERNDLLIIGGEDHKTGQEKHPFACFSLLETWARRRFPFLSSIDYRWSGQILEPIDGLAYLGKNPLSEKTYIITGDSGNGLTHGTIGAMLVADLIAGRPNPWAALYNPSRKNWKAAKEFTKENLNVACQYAQWVAPGDKRSMEEIPKNSGAVIQEGMKKIAVYRDEEGNMHRFSATCTHLGCIVQWNAVESSWDCPCHGSRFDKDGNVLAGPALTKLHSADEA